MYFEVQNGFSNWSPRALVTVPRHKQLTTGAPWSLRALSRMGNTGLRLGRDTNCERSPPRNRKLYAVM